MWKLALLAALASVYKSLYQSDRSCYRAHTVWHCGFSGSTLIARTPKHEHRQDNPFDTQSICNTEIVALFVQITYIHGVKS